MGSGLPCNFASRIVTVNHHTPDAGTSMLLNNHGIGFWGWGFDGNCYSYEIAGAKPTFDTAFKASNALVTVTAALGGFCMVCVFLGTCFPISPRNYRLLGYALFLNGIFEFSTLAILGSSACAPGFFSYATGSVVDLAAISTASCGVGTGSKLAISAGIFSIFAAIACLKTPLSNKDRVPKLMIGPSGSDGLDENDPSKKIHQERQFEAEKRYKEMFGDDDDDDDALNDAFPARHMSRLSSVPEGDMETSGHRPPATQNKSSSLDEDMAFHDEGDDEDDDGDIPATGSSFQRAPVANYRDSFGAKETTTKGNQSNLFDYDDVSFGASKDSSHAFKKNPFDDDDDELQSLADSEIV